MLRDRGRKGGKRRAVVDQAAAVLILQHALDTERATGAAPGEIVEETQMTDEHDQYDVEPPTARRRACSVTPRTTGPTTPGGRRRGRKRRSVPGLPRRAGGARGRRRRLLLRGHVGRRRRQGPVRLARGLRRARATARSSSRCEQGDTRRRDGPQPEGRRASSPRSTRSPTPRSPTRTPPDPVRLLPAQEGDGRRRRRRRPRRPGEPGEEHGHDPRGAPGRPRSSTSSPRSTDFTRPRTSRRCWPTPTSSGCPTTRRATPRATCSRRPTTSARTTTRSRCSPRMVDRWKQAADDADLEARPPSSATPRPS